MFLLKYTVVAMFAISLVFLAAVLTGTLVLEIRDRGYASDLAQKFWVGVVSMVMGIAALVLVVTIPYSLTSVYKSAAYYMRTWI